MAENLKPCPFCGGEATIRKYVDGSYCVSCDNDDCNMVVMTVVADTEERAIELWNNRPSNWHTGTPSEEGDYWVAFRWGLDNEIMHHMASIIQYGATAFVNGNWRIDYPYVVVAWQKIEKYVEKDK